MSTFAELTYERNGPQCPVLGRAPGPRPQAPGPRFHSWGQDLRAQDWPILDQAPDPKICSRKLSPNSQDLFLWNVPRLS